MILLDLNACSVEKQYLGFWLFVYHDNYLFPSVNPIFYAFFFTSICIYTKISMRHMWGSLRSPDKYNTFAMSVGSCVIK